MSELDARLAAIAERFVLEAPVTAEGLTTSLRECAWTDLSRQSHSLAGRAGMFGFSAIGAAAAELERAIDSGTSIAEITNLTEQLVRMLAGLNENIVPITDDGAG